MRRAGEPKRLEMSGDGRLAVPGGAVSTRGLRSLHPAPSFSTEYISRGAGSKRELLKVQKEPQVLLETFLHLKYKGRHREMRKGAARRFPPEGQLGVSSGQRRADSSGRGASPYGEMDTQRDI